MSWFGRGEAEAELEARAASGYSSSDLEATDAPRRAAPGRGRSVIAPSSPTKTRGARRLSWFGRGEAASGHSSSELEIEEDRQQRGAPQRGVSVFRSFSPTRTRGARRMSWFGRGEAEAELEARPASGCSSSDVEATDVPRRAAPGRGRSVIAPSSTAKTRGARRMSWFGRGEAASGHSSSDLETTDVARHGGAPQHAPKPGVSVDVPSSPTKPRGARRMSWFGRSEAVAQQRQFAADLEAAVIANLSSSSSSSSSSSYSFTNLETTTQTPPPGRLKRDTSEDSEHEDADISEQSGHEKNALDEAPPTHGPPRRDVSVSLVGRTPSVSVTPTSPSTTSASPTKKKKKKMPGSKKWWKARKQRALR
jgi:hypothetical protein